MEQASVKNESISNDETSACGARHEFLDAAADYFDRSFSRMGTYSASYDTYKAEFSGDFLSLAIAEMDFEVAPAIKSAIVEAAQKGIYSYTEVFPEYFTACQRWLSVRHGWNVDTQDMLFSPRIIEAVSAVVGTVFRGQSVATFSPYYSPIIEVVRRSGAQLTEIPLELSESGWEFDRARLGQVFKEIAIFILTNPHNPTGRVWRVEELREIADLARTHGVLIISDDAHCDFAWGANTYSPLARIAPDLASSGKLITCISPSKSFNIAGLESAVVICPDSVLRDKIHGALRAAGIHNPNYFAIPAAIAAWQKCDDWFEHLRAYVACNIKQAIELIHELAPEFGCIPPEGTYLLWVDSAECGFATQDYLSASHAAHVIISPGRSFGNEWDRFFRLSLAVPRPRLIKGLSEIIGALKHSGGEQK